MSKRTTRQGGRRISRRRKKVLLCVTGGRPQGVTRAIWGLARSDVPWLPDEVVVVTTRKGERRIIEHLFEGSQFARLCRALGVAGIDLRPENVRVITGAAGQPLEDIASADDERAAGDFIIDQVARLTDVGGSELRVALTGERHLIGFFAGHALSLLGRRQDRLVHVRVPAPAHRDPGFFFPRSGGEGPVSVTDVPFVRVDRLVSMRLLARHVDYATMCTAFEDRAHLEVRNAFRGIVFRFSRAFDIPCDSSHNVRPPRFEPRAAALYAYYALRARQRLPYISDAELLADPTYLLELYDACLLGGSSKSLDPKWRAQLTRDALISARSRIGRTLKTLIKDGSKYQSYRVHTCRQKRSYGLDLARDQIRFRDWSPLLDTTDRIGGPIGRAGRQ